MNSEAEAAFKDATEGEDVNVVEEASDDEFIDASEDNDLTRPSDWTPHTKSQESVPEVTEQTEVAEETEETVDSTGNSAGSPDYVDERLLEEQEKTLSEEEREQRGTQANQCKQDGNTLYKEGKTLEAVDKYTAGLRICPLSCTKERAVLYANRGQMKKVLGLNDQAVRNCSKAIELDPEYLKAILRRAEVYEEMDKLDESLTDYKRVLELDPAHTEANRSVRRLPPKIEERNERLKAEMMDSLKKLGNMVLKPFGLSTENFKMEQDPNSGGYNIQFSQNK